MRVLHVSSSIDPRDGGAAMVVCGLAQAQARNGLDVTVATTWRGQLAQAAADHLRSAGVQLHLIGPAHTALSWNRLIRPILRQAIAKSDVVHIHALWEEIQHRAARLCQSTAKPYLITPHGMLDPWSLSQSRLKKNIYLKLRLRRNLNRAAALHFTAQAERDLVAGMNLTPPSIVEPNGLDLSEFQSLPPRGSFRQLYPQLKNHPIVLFLSRLHPKKGLDLLIPAFATARLGDAMLVVAGPDSNGYQAKIQAAADAAGIGDRLVFTGMLRGIHRVEALVDADLFVLPSYQENFAIVVAEALAAQTPVVISDQVNIQDQIKRAGVGGVVRLDVAEIAGEMERWMADPERRRDAGRHGRQFVWEHYDWQKIAVRWIGHYSSLCPPPLDTVDSAAG